MTGGDGCTSELGLVHDLAALRTVVLTGSASVSPFSGLRQDLDFDHLALDQPLNTLAQDVQALPRRNHDQP